MRQRPGTKQVSERHRVDAAALDRWLSANLEGFRGPAEISQFDGGQSNPTFLLGTASGEYVLRKKPPGKLLPSAHAIDREYRVLQALSGSTVPVPVARVYCADEAIIGTPFYVMDYQPGRIFTDPLLPGLPPEERRAIYDAMNDALARLHGFDWAGAGLADYGKTENYLQRQVARWAKQYEASKTEDVPAMDKLREWVLANIPSDSEVSIVHGDFRIGNLIFAEEDSRVVAVLDWELSTLGNPLSDLSFNCMTYHLPAGDPVAAGFIGVDADALGIPSEADYLTAYARRTGRNEIRDWKFFMAFSLFRTAAIQQGVYARSRQGNASSAHAERFGKSFVMVAERGWELVS